MQISKIFCFLLFFILSNKQVLAEKKSYIVYLGGHSHGPQITSADLQRVTNSHVNLLSSFVGSKEKAKDVMLYSYQRHINGFAAILEEEEAANIAKHPGVVSVFPNKLLKLQTSHSWDFLGLEKKGGGNGIHLSSLWKQANFGENIIIAHLDGGVWPESESFNDNGYGPIPSKWKGICVNDTKSGVPCNRKIIGTRYFINGYNADSDSTVVPGYMQTPRDYDGHGTHTLSTSSGNFVNASIGGLPVGTIKGGSPKARVAVYKVCWTGGGCAEADILQAFDYAIDDGVDVISASIGSFFPQHYFRDTIAIGSFHAMKKNIVVCAAAGNALFGFGMVTNVAPWIITVGSSTIDRSFTSAVLLPNGLKLQGGGSISKSMEEKKYYPIIYARDAKAAESSFENASECQPESLDMKKVKGKILVCLLGNEGDHRGIVARDAGAVGMILCNTKSFGDSISSHVDYIPSIQINYKNSILLFKYMNSTTQPTGFITDTYTNFGLKPSPSVSYFSLGGPNLVTPDILKPDLVAPGEDIIASFSPAAIVKNEEESDDFAMLSGTSMACPHVSGVVGLLKKIHPDWSPAAIRSALITTARTRDNTGNPMTKVDPESTNKTTPYFYGAGHIQPNRAANPGLVYDLTIDDHLNFLCAINYTQEQIKLVSGGSYLCPKDVVSARNLNYPSITVGNINEVPASSSGVRTVTMSRTLKNVGVAPVTYSAAIRSSLGVSVTVDPEILRFEKVGDERSFKLTIEVKGNLTSDVFGHLVWSDGIRHKVRSTIVVGTGL